MKATGVRAMEGFMAWTSSRSAARAAWGAVQDVGIVLPYMSQAVLAARVVIRKQFGRLGEGVRVSGAQ